MTEGRLGSFMDSIERDLVTGLRTGHPHDRVHYIELAVEQIKLLYMIDLTNIHV